MSLFSGYLPGSLIKLRILDQERQRGFAPALMAEAVELGDEADAVVSGLLCQLSGAGPGHELGTAQLRVRLEFKAIIDLHDQGDSLPWSNTSATLR